MATPGDPECALIGRRGELGVLRGLLDDLAGGRGRCVLIEGEPGSGKTALLDTLAEAAGPDRAGFAAAAGDPPAQPLAVLFKALGEDGGGPAADAVERVFALVDQRCADGPLLLALDDLHAADEASLLVWQRLCAVATRSPLLLVGTLRPVPRRTEIDRLRRILKDCDGVHLTLDRLLPRDVADLAGRLIGARPGPRLAARLESAGGNPRYVHELTDALVGAQMIEVCDGLAELVGGDAPDPVDALAADIADRLGFLGAATVEALRTAALLGPQFAVTDLSAALHRPAGALAAAVQEAVAAGVLEAVGARLRFRHGLLRQALTESVPSADRTALRHATIRALMESAAPVERIAELLAADLDVADGWETPWVARHAELIARRAPDLAAELFEHVLGHAGITAPRRVALLEGFAALSFTLLGLGRTAEADRLAGKVQAEPELPRIWRARLAARAAKHPREVTDALAEGERLTDLMTIGYALYAESSLRFHGADMTGCLEVVDRALSGIGPPPRVPDLHLLLTARRSAALADQAYRLGRWDDACAEIESSPNQGDVHGMAALIAVHCDDEPTAARHIESMTGMDAYGPLARAAYAERANRPGEALEALRGIIEARHPAPGLPMLVRLALHTGELRLANAAAAGAQENEWCDGLIAADPDQLSATVDRFRTAGRLPELGQALEDQAVLYARGGRQSEARMAAGEALAVYAQFGAAWDARRTAARLRLDGVRLGVRAGRRPGTGPDALTKSEQRIAERVGQGRSNSDIAAELSLSPRTVESHVSRILAKLGVRSRREVAVALRRD